MVDFIICPVLVECVCWDLLNDNKVTLKELLSLWRSVTFMVVIYCQFSKREKYHWMKKKKYYLYYDETNAFLMIIFRWMMILFNFLFSKLFLFCCFCVCMFDISYFVSMDYLNSSKQHYDQFYVILVDILMIPYRVGIFLSKYFEINVP